MASLVLLDHDGGQIKQPSRSAVAAAAQLGEVHVLVAGEGVGDAAAAAAKLPGVTKVHVADGPAYSHSLAEPLAALLVGALALAGAGEQRIVDRVKRQYKAFVHLSPQPGSFRLISGGGNRYDYWRVAARTWVTEPIGGVGGGNYPEPYYRTRRTTEYWHFDLAGEHRVEESSTDHEELAGVTCRWCGRSDAIELVSRAVADASTP